MKIIKIYSKSNDKRIGDWKELFVWPIDYKKGFAVEEVCNTNKKEYKIHIATEPKLTYNFNFERRIYLIFVDEDPVPYKISNETELDYFLNKELNTSLIINDKRWAQYIKEAEMRPDFDNT